MYFASHRTVGRAFGMRVKSTMIAVRRHNTVEVAGLDGTKYPCMKLHASGRFLAEFDAEQN